MQRLMKYLNQKPNVALWNRIQINQNPRGIGFRVSFKSKTFSNLEKGFEKRVTAPT